MKSYWLVSLAAIGVAASLFAFSYPLTRYMVANYYIFMNGRTIAANRLCYEVSAPWFIIAKRRSTYSLGQLVSIRNTQSVTLRGMKGPTSGGPANDASIVFSDPDVTILDLRTSMITEDIPASARYLLKVKEGNIAIVGPSEDLTRSAFKSLSVTRCDS